MGNAFITKLGCWTQLSAEAQARVGNLSSERLSLARGEHPLTGIDPAKCSLLMLDGWAANYKDMPSGKRIIVEFLLPGDLKLASAHRDRSMGTVMLSPGSVLLIRPEEMATLMDDAPMRDAIAWIEKVRETILAEWLVNISSRPAYPRLAHLLCELGMRMNSAGLLSDGICEMPLTQVDLANALGMTNVHLNIVLNRLRREKIIDISNRRLKILNQRRLDAVADFDDQYLLRWPTALSDRRKVKMAPVMERRRSAAY